MLEHDSKYNELKKLYNSKRLEFDSLKKSSGDMIKYLEQKCVNLSAKIDKMNI